MARELDAGGAGIGIEAERQMLGRDDAEVDAPVVEKVRLVRLRGLLRPCARPAGTRRVLRGPQCELDRLPQVLRHGVEADNIRLHDSGPQIPAYAEGAAGKRAHAYFCDHLLDSRDLQGGREPAALA